MTGAAYKIRTVVILAVLSIWAAGAAVNLYIHSIRNRETLLKKARLIAWRQANIPAQRGRILDRSGKLLAQDELHCNLFLEALPKKTRKAENLLRRLRRTFPGLKLEIDQNTTFPICLKKRLSAEEIRKFSQIFRGFPEVRIAGGFERQYPSDPAIRELIGETALNDLKERVGISGLEQHHDLLLSGKPGRLVVMLDRNGNWIYDTLRIVKQPENGRDLRLDQTWEELQGNKAGESYEL
ncbi:MAG: hypothetical protein J5858_13705 [Lentisphaeria bacterium]|nr:hypothetical protein [Lentisphaeria bacterium]